MIDNEIADSYYFCSSCRCNCRPRALPLSNRSWELAVAVVAVRKPERCYFCSWSCVLEILESANFFFG